MIFKKGDTVREFHGDVAVGTIVGTCKRDYGYGYIVQVNNGIGNTYERYDTMLYERFRLQPEESEGKLYWWYAEGQIKLASFLNHPIVKTKFLEGFQL